MYGLIYNSRKLLHCIVCFSSVKVSPHCVSVYSCPAVFQCPYDVLASMGVFHGQSILENLCPITVLFGSAQLEFLHIVLLYTFVLLCLSVPSYDVLASMGVLHRQLLSCELISQSANLNNLAEFQI